MKTRCKVTGQDGISLIEVLFAALILGIAITGLTLLLSRSQEFVIAQGDTRVALYLAQQKIEKLSGQGFGAAWVPVGGSLNYTDAIANNGCANPDQNNEPCYNETISTRTGETPGLTQVDTQSFTRLTCVRWVQDDNPELPADVLEPPSAWTCPSCAPAVIDAVTGLCTANCNCSKNTKRIKVAVIPTLLGGANDSTSVDPNRVTLEAVLTPVAKP